MDAVSREAAVQERLDELHAELGFPGATAAWILPSGERGLVATGVADLESGEPMTPDHRMPAASIGKTFVAAAALRLTRQGLDLDAPVRERLGGEPWFPALPNAGQLTLRHLLSHTGGLEDHVFDDVWRAEAKRRRSLPDDQAWFRPAELAAVLAGRDPLFAVDRGYNYTDTGYVVAGLALETDCGDILEMIRREFLEPLGLSRTEAQFGRTYDRLASGYVRLDEQEGHVKVAERGTMRLHPRTEWTGGGFVSNPWDLATWAEALYGGDVLTAEELREMTDSGYRGDDADAVYGLGVFLEETDFGPLIGHGGWFPGWRSTLYRHRPSGTVVAAQINLSEPDHRATVRNALFETLLERL